MCVPVTELLSDPTRMVGVQGNQKHIILQSSKGLKSGQLQIIALWRTVHLFVHTDFVLLNNTRKT